MILAPVANSYQHRPGFKSQVWLDYHVITIMIITIIITCMPAMLANQYGLQWHLFRVSLCRHLSVHAKKTGNKLLVRN